jgi:hypothetical protein
MIIALSGSQGCGKSTTAKGIIEKFPEYSIIGENNAREVMKEFGTTSLANIYADIPLTMEFQDRILDRKHEQELEFHDTPDIFIAERSYIDLLAYSTVVVGPFNKYSRWLDEYTKKCIALNQGYATTLFMLRPFSDMDIQNDTVRSTNKTFAIGMEGLMLSLFSELLSPEDYTPIGEKSIESRIYSAIAEIERL